MSYDDDEDEGYVDEEGQVGEGEVFSNDEDDFDNVDRDEDHADTIKAIEDEIHQAIRKRKEEKHQQQHHSLYDGGAESYHPVNEYLDENFEDTPWVPPSLEIAWEYHLSHLYRGGKIPLSKIKLTKATDIGLGIPMYFLYTKIFSYIIFLMACCSLPAIIFSFFGQRISSENKDILQLYRFTIGNIGYDSDSTDYLNQVRCTGSTSLSCITLFTQEFSLQSIANILMICEILQIFLYFIGIYLLKLACSHVRGGIGNRTCCVSDYAIRVDNIPSNTTINELLEHFNNLYSLNQIDWKNRKPLDGATPVANIYHNGNSLYKGSWIAEIVIYGKIGKLIRSFKLKRKNMEELLKYRAMMKMYKEDTCHAHGPDPKRYRRAEENMLYAGTKIDVQTKKALASAKANAQTTTEHHPASQIKGLKSDAVCAFITFNYSESMARCVDDYRFYNTFPFSLFMPSRLKFRGHHIKVTHAPEPDEIVWENVEISNTAKISRRIFSGLVAFLLMLIGFACILQSAKYRRIFDANVPQLSMCDSEIPALYAGTYNLPSGVEIVRPDREGRKDELTRADYDRECNKYVDKSFYAIYTKDGNFNNPLANYSIENVCEYSGSAATSICPQYGDQLFCPCILTKSSTDCSTLQCSLGGTCEQFKYTTIAGCYCYQQLTNLLTSSVFDLLYNLQHVDTECEEFLTGYIIAIGLLLIASLVTVVLNFFLKTVMTFLSRREFHVTNAEEQRAIVVKIFGTTYINMAFVVLLAYGYVRNEPKLLVEASIMHGEYSDFSSDWYANIGPYLTVTFLLQALGPIAANLYQYFISAPCKRCYAFPQISSMTSHKYVRQADVNALELGKVFDVTTNTAQLLALLFFAMTYSPGIPILMPLCALVFIIYFNVDKRLLLRYYHKPPKMGDAVMRVVLEFLPWAAVMRLAFGCWMLSNHQLFPDSKLLINKIPNFPYFNSEYVSHIYNHWIRDHAGQTIYIFNTGHRILRGHVFPLFVLLVIIFVPMVVYKFWRYSPFYILQRTISLFISNLKKLNPHKSSATVKPFDLVATGDELRSEMAPFTGDYFQFLRSELVSSKWKCFTKLLRRLRNDLTPEELEEGWRVSYQGANKVRMIQWNETVSIGGVRRPKGSLKRTYEIISSHGCISYALAKIPHYTKVIAAIQEGVTSILADNDEEMGTVSIVGAYHKNQQKKQDAVNDKIKQKEEVWTKKKPKPSKVVPTNEDSKQQTGMNIPRGYDNVQVFSDDGQPIDDDDDDDLDDIDD